MNMIYRPLFLFKDLYVDMNPGGIQSKNFVNAIKNKGIYADIFTKQTHNKNTENNKGSIHFVNEIPHRYFSYIARRVFPDLLFLPDIERYTYLPFLMRKLKIELSSNNYDWIHSISFPCSSHLTGLFLKKRLKIPWIAQFYDPWIGNCYRKYKTNILRKYDQKLEYKVAKNADIIIHTNEVIKNDWVKRYGNIVSDKIFVLPFCYDEKVKPVRDTSEKPKNSKISVLYIGNLYLDRNLDDLIQALNILRTKIPNLEDRIVFKFIGIVSKYDKMNIKKNNLERFFVLLGQKPYCQLADYYKEADVMLVIDAPSDANLFFPSKLIEYFLHQKPIIGISPRISATHDILIDSGHNSIENGRITEIVDYFNLLVNDYNSVLSYNYNYYKNYSPDLLADKYISLIENHVLNKKNKKEVYA